MSLNTTRVTVYVRKDEEARPVRVSAKIPRTGGGAAWIANSEVLKPGECNTFWLGSEQDLLFTEVRE